VLKLPYSNLKFVWGRTSHSLGRGEEKGKWKMEVGKGKEGVGTRRKRERAGEKRVE